LQQLSPAGNIESWPKKRELMLQLESGPPIKLLLLHPLTECDHDPSMACKFARAHSCMHATTTTTTTKEALKKLSQQRLWLELLGLQEDQNCE